MIFAFQFHSPEMERRGAEASEIASLIRPIAPPTSSAQLLNRRIEFGIVPSLYLPDHFPGLVNDQRRREHMDLVRAMVLPLATAVSPAPTDGSAQSKATVKGILRLFQS